jgi:predicted nuclease with TOPRIM domain
MTVKERFRPEISLGAIIQIVILIVGMAVSWAIMDARSQQNTEAIRDVKEQIERLPNDLKGEFDGKTVRIEERVRSLENTAARSDERFSNLIALLSKLDSRLERIESALQRP